MIRRPRRKTACIRVRDHAVAVIVPGGLPRKQIEQMVLSKRQWIVSKLRQQRELRASHQPRQYANGEAFAYLGRNYRLRIASGKRKPACLNHGRMTVHIPAGLKTEEREQEIIRQLSAWYQKHALTHLQDKSAQFAARLAVAPNHIGIKSYRRRWGSCHIDGRIYFNWRIIMAPHFVVDYVVAHELCHLVQHNHSPAYWNLLASLMPDYRSAKN
ncbi:MAG: SprT family zinc-dependent metalloprotease, partial [Mariprofundaceae bacterium]